MILEQLEPRDTPSFTDILPYGGVDPRTLPGIPDATIPVTAFTVYANSDAYADWGYYAGDGGSARVVIYDGQSGDVLLDTIAFDPSFRGGCQVAVVPGPNNHATPDSILVVPGPGGGPQVAQFELSNATGQLVETHSFFAPYSTAFRGGLKVTTGDVNGDGQMDAIFLPGVGGGPQMAAVDMRTHETLFSVWVGDPGDLSGSAAFDPAGGVVDTPARGVAVEVSGVVTVVGV